MTLKARSPPSFCGCCAASEGARLFSGSGGGCGGGSGEDEDEDRDKDEDGGYGSDTPVYPFKASSLGVCE